MRRRGEDKKKMKTKKRSRRSWEEEQEKVRGLRLSGPDSQALPDSGSHVST